MRYRRLRYTKWGLMLIVYICILLFGYRLGLARRRANLESFPILPRHRILQRIFSNQLEYLNSSMIVDLINNQSKHRMVFDVPQTSESPAKHIRQALVVFYDVSLHYLLFQQFLWLHLSWLQLHSHPNIQNDLLLFISSSSIPKDFEMLARYTTHYKNQFHIIPCQTLTDAILGENYHLLSNFSLHFHMELARLFHWQQTRLSSMLLFLIDEYRGYLSAYDSIFRLDVDSILMPNFGQYQQSTSLTIGETTRHDAYTAERLNRIRQFFQKTPPKYPSIHRLITISWFGSLPILSELTRRTITIALWLMKEEFTEAERFHQLAYLNYPSWYIDAILEYATAIVLSCNEFRAANRAFRFDCNGISSPNCLHYSIRDPSPNSNLSKHVLQQLLQANQSNLTENEQYIQLTVAKANAFYQLHRQKKPNSSEM